MRTLLQLLVGFLGVIELLAPRQVIAVVTRLAYRSPTPDDPREWVYTAARLEGAVLVVVALLGLYRAAQENATDAGSDVGVGDGDDETTDAI